MKVLMAAGGTGGHVIPALAVAAALRAIDAKTEILFVGTRKGWENRLVPQQGYGLEFLDVGGLKGKSWVERLTNLLKLPGAFFDSWKLLRRFAPSVVFGIGGYASGPVLCMAALTGRKTAILEPNSVAGFSNRILGRIVRRIFLAFDDAAMFFSQAKCRVTGNPVREDIAALPPPDFTDDRKTVLVFGGSQGARRLNEAMVAALPLLAPMRSRLSIIHQTGGEMEFAVRRAYRDAGVEAQVHAFIGPMADAYRKAHLVVARSGSSVLEIAACGRPSVLVPYPSAADDHQRVNARIFEKAGAAVVIEDAECTGVRLGTLLKDLLSDKQSLQKMSTAAITFRKDDPASAIAGELRDLAGEPHA